MKVLCLCPTYGRPKHLIENTLACFQSQTYSDSFLLILDDLGTYRQQRGDRWSLVSSTFRSPSLPAKYHRMLSLVEWYPWDLLVVWDDDDVYLPQHLELHVRALQEHRRKAYWSHPDFVWSNYTGRLLLEPAAGRFHGALAVTRDGFNKVGGWPQTKRADFDQQFIGILTHGVPGSISGLLRVDPLALEGGEPTYVFRWRDTGAPHCQSLMASPDNADWYNRVPPSNQDRCTDDLQPNYDPSTTVIIQTLYQRFVIGDTAGVGTPRGTVEWD